MRWGFASPSPTRGRVLWVIAGFLFLVAVQSFAKSTSLPELVGVTQWLNTQTPPTRATFKGKVVLVDFWTFSCINCIRTVPYLNAWYKKYHDQGFEIVGVHTPEFHFEKDPANVQNAITKFAIPYLVAMDNDYKTWDAYGSRAWPSDYLADRNGIIRFQHFGEGNYETIEQEIQKLLAENNPAFVKPSSTGRLNAVAFEKIKTPEIFLGVFRLSHFGNAEAVSPGRTQVFQKPPKIAKSHFYLSGDWRFLREYAELMSSEGEILIRFDASKANMVLAGPPDREVLAEVLIDGQPATDENKGTDVLLEGGKAWCKIQTSRLYNFVRSNYGEHTLELRFRNPGLKAYTFTFG